MPALRICLLALAAVFLTGVAPDYVPHHQILVRNLKPTTLYARPGGSKRVARLASGSNLDLISCRKTWCHVKYATLTGFVRRRLLQYMPDNAPPSFRVGPHSHH